jgi:hypothetical protein
MTVVINDFELVAEPPPVPGEQPQSTQQKAPEVIVHQMELALRQLHERGKRVSAQ